MWQINVNQHFNEAKNAFPVVGSPSTRSCIFVMLRPPAFAARRLRAAARRRKSLAVAAPSTDGSSIPTAPGRLPLVGHALNFKPPKMHEYLEGVARDLDAWAFVAHFGPRTPVVVGDPALAQALLAPRSGWTGRSAAVLPFFRDSSDAIVGDPEAQGVAFANGNFHWGLARKASEDGLLKTSFVQRSHAIIKDKAAELGGILRDAGGAPVDVQTLFARTALDIVGSLAFEADIGSAAGDKTELEARLKAIFTGIGECIGAPLPYWRWGFPAPASVLWR